MRTSLFLRRLFLSVGTLIVFCVSLNAQKMVEIIHSDNFRSTELNDIKMEYLHGEVHLVQGNTVLYCDSAIVSDRSLVKAYGNVNIQQGDSINVWGDTAVFNAKTRKANLIGRAILTDTRATINSKQIDYDLNTKIASYQRGAMIESEKAKLYSQKGSYDLKTKMAYFKKEVKLEHPEYRLTADSLKFNTETKIAYFTGPTYIFNKESQLYCEKGFYDTENNKAEFAQNARYFSKERLATADKILYDGKTGKYDLIGNAHFKDTKQEVYADAIHYDSQTEKYTFEGKTQMVNLEQKQSVVADNSFYDAKTGTAVYRGNVVLKDSIRQLNTDTLDYNSKTHWANARGNVVLRDSNAHILLMAGKADLNDSTGYMIATRHPLLSMLIEKDSLHIVADTLLTFKKNAEQKADSTRNLVAYRNVWIYKNDLQAKCDSLAYSSADSIFRFYQNPIIWADSTQFSADTLLLALRNKKIQTITMLQNAFIINTTDRHYFNQIKGRDIVGYFHNNEIRRMNVIGNGETVYYLKDEKNAYIGVNQTICSKMLLYFGNNKVDKIMFYTEPKATLYPMGQVNHTTLQLKGFKWSEDIRPKNKAALLKYRYQRIQI